MPQQPTTNSDAYPNSDHEKQFMEIVHRRLGLTLDKKAKNIPQLLSSACKTCACPPSEYLRMLASCTSDSPILKHLITEITVGESYFFRDENQMYFLQHTLLPKIIQQKRKEKHLSLRIWSAGCSTGEEIYTMAMLLNELLPDINQWDLHLLGTDINTEALHQAKLAQYKKWSLRTISNYHSQHYLTENRDHFALSPKIRDCVNFLYLNLNDHSYPSIVNGTQSQDLILCRNVFIYFNKNSVTSAMKRFSKCLAEEGYLILGASDPVCIESTNLIYHHHDGLVFSREKLNNPKSMEQGLENLKKKEPIKAVNKAEAEAKGRQIILTNAPSLEVPNRALTLYNKAKTMADTGQLDLALSFCEESLRLIATNKDSYFLYALILMEGNRWVEAEKALRRCLFLDRKCVEGHFQLGLLLLKKKCFAEGLKSLHNALKIVEAYPPEATVPQSQGLSFKRFGEIIHTEIAAYTEAGSFIHERKKQ